MGWTVFATGLLVVAYRIHGIDAPRSWIEWVERQFTYIVKLRFFGGILVVAALALAYLGGMPKSPNLLVMVFWLSLILLFALGFGLLVLQNHVRHLVLASAESSDVKLRIASIIVVLISLGWLLAPFFF
jgi:hypothetical protein